MLRLNEKKTYIKSVLNSAIALCLEEKSNQKEEKENEKKIKIIDGPV